MRIDLDVRTVQVHIEPEESEAIQDSWGRGELRPHVGTVGVDREGVRSVILAGPISDVRIQGGEWSWNRQAGTPWPPPGAPKVALDLVGLVLATATQGDDR